MAVTVPNKSFIRMVFFSVWWRMADSAGALGRVPRAEASPLPRAAECGPLSVCYGFLSPGSDFQTATLVSSSSHFLFS